MKKLSFVIMFLLFMVSICFAAGIIEIGGGTLGTVNTVDTITSVTGGAIDNSGFSYTPVTKTRNQQGYDYDYAIWTPASGKKIVLMGITFSADEVAKLLIRDNSSTIIPPLYNTASGVIVISSGSPIWQGSTNQILTTTVTGTIVTNSTTLLWGYEK